MKHQLSDGQEEFKSPDEAEAKPFEAVSRSSPWRVVVAQAVEGLVMTVLCWLVITGRERSVRCFYGRGHRGIADGAFTRRHDG